MTPPQSPSNPSNVWLLGNHVPRRCGIATFTSDLADALEANGVTVKVAAMNDGREHDYPARVELPIPQDDLAAYIEAAERMNRSGASAVIVQHEFGIFGGEAGSYLLTLLRFLKLPVIVTLHTVLAEPDEWQRRVMVGLLDRADRVVVMTQRARKMVRQIYGRDAGVVVIPHGVPDSPSMGRDKAKATFGWTGRDVVLTFGLLSPDKGIETMIEAMADVVQAKPNALYVIAGQSHPHQVKAHGEAYRESLEALVVKHGLQNHVQFVNKFLDLPDLCLMLEACDLYVTPYLKLAQITSGTLSYAVGMGRAVVSTPYWHAEELLSEGCGKLVPPRNAKQLAKAVGQLLVDRPARDQLETVAWRIGEETRWTKIGARYLETTREVDRTKVAAQAGAQRSTTNLFGHLMALTDDIGLIQHATYDIPNRHEGYCTDDNARALSVLWSAPKGLLSAEDYERLERVYLAFTLHAWNESSHAFRNFMGFDRRWLEEVGSEDCHGRTLVALARGARMASTAGRRALCSRMFRESWCDRLGRASLRCAAQTLSAAAEWVQAPGGKLEDVVEQADAAARRLIRAYDNESTDDWLWFEPLLTYDNARLPQALIEWGLAADEEKAVDCGLATLNWLCRKQERADVFWPVGNDGFWMRGMPRPNFDQQPLEAWATAEACVAAYEATKQARWIDHAQKALDWFYGRNTAGVSLVDPNNGACCDGLGSEGPNQNKGAESGLAYLATSFAVQTLTPPQKAVVKPASLL